MKKITVAVILTLYTFIQLGIMGWHYYQPIIHAFCYQQFRTKSEAPGNIFTIHTDKTTYYSCRQPDNEIKWQGDLYDIKSVEINGGLVTIVMEKDELETKLTVFYRGIQDEISKNKLPHSPTDISFYQWVFKFYQPADNSKEFSNAMTIVPKNNLFRNSYVYAFFPNSPFQPPDFMI